MKLVLALFFAVFLTAAPVSVQWSAGQPVVTASVAEAGGITGTIRRAVSRIVIGRLVVTAVKYAGTRAGQIALTRLSGYLNNPKTRDLAKTYIIEAATDYMAKHPEMIQTVKEVAAKLDISLEKDSEDSGDCTPKEKRELQERMEDICSSKRSCKGNDDIATLRRKIDLFDACIDARLLIMHKCFGGGDDEHKAHVDQEKRGRDNCKRILSQGGRK